MKIKGQKINWHHQYDFFQDVSYVGTSVEVMVPPHKFADFSDITRNLKFEHKLIVKNLQK
jgi:hypothetical protein